MGRKPKPPYDPNDEVQVKARKTQVEIRRDQELDDLRQVLKTPHGRRVFWRLWEEARVFQGTHTPGDPYQTAFNEGHRNLGRMFLMDVFEGCPERFSQAQAEAATTQIKEEEANG